MFSEKSIRIGTLLGLGTFLIFAGRAVRLYNAGEKLVIVPNIGFGASWQGLIITADAVVKNPTSTAFQVAHPFVKVLLGDRKAVVGSSTPENKKYTVVANGETNMDRVSILIQWVKVPALLQAAKTGILKAFIDITSTVFIDFVPINAPIHSITEHNIDTSSVAPYL
jgi:hypothetical protein